MYFALIVVLSFLFCILILLCTPPNYYHFKFKNAFYYKTIKKTILYSKCNIELLIFYNII